MKKVLFTSLKLLLPLGFGIFLIYRFYDSLTPEDLDEILRIMRSSDYTFLYLSMFLGLMSHVMRAWRWRIPLANLNYYPKFRNSFFTVMVNYIANLGIPRSGELIRCGLMSRYENIPLNKLLGTVIAERVIDLILLVTFIFLSLALHFDAMLEIFNEYNVFNKLLEAKVYVPIIIALLLIYFFLKRSLKKSKRPFVKKVRTFFKGIIDGLISVIRMERKWQYLFETFLIWFFYYLLFYVPYLALPSGTPPLSFSVSIIGFVVGGIAITLTNGGVGAYPLAIAYILTLFGIDNNVGYAFGWMAWITQIIMIIVFGLLSIILLPIVNKDKMTLEG